jgi:hypothetical protein
MELAYNTCYRNGINGVVVHKTDRAYVHHNLLYDNGQVSKEEPESRQAYAGFTMNTATLVHFYGNNVTVTDPTDSAFQSVGSEFVSNENYVNYACNGKVSGFGDLVRTDHLEMCWVYETSPPTTSPTPAPSILREFCEDQHSAVELPAGNTWNSYTYVRARDFPRPTKLLSLYCRYSCRNSLGGDCLSDESFCEGTWHATGYCGNSALGTSCGCCEPLSEPEETVPPTLSPTVSPTPAPSKVPTTSPTLAPSPSPTLSPSASPTSAPSLEPTAAPTALEAACEDAHADVVLPADKTWNSYTYATQSERARFLTSARVLTRERARGGACEGINLSWLASARMLTRERAPGAACEGIYLNSPASA